MFASSSLEEVYHYVYYQLTSVALTMLDDVNGLSINFFSNEFIQAIVNFFTLFAWGLGLTGAAIAIMDFAVSYQTGGGGSFTGTGMNMLRLLVALLTFSSIPILLFQTSMALPVGQHKRRYRVRLSKFLTSRKCGDTTKKAVRLPQASSLI